MLSNIIGLVSGCVTFLGGFLVVWGAVSLGLAIREQQGGAQIASAISMAVTSTTGNVNSGKPIQAASATGVKSTIPKAHERP